MPITTLPIWFSLLYSLGFLLIFPAVILTQHYGWLWGILAYGLFVTTIAVISSNVQQHWLERLLSWVNAIPFFVALHLWLGLTSGLLALLGLALFVLGLNYWRYQKDRRAITKHRAAQAIPTPFQLPPQLPSSYKRKIIHYFDQASFDTIVKDTILLPLSLKYTLNGQAYEAAYTYYWQLPEKPITDPAALYAREISQQKFYLQHPPQQPHQLQTVYSENYLSSFEAYAMQDFKKSLLSSFVHTSWGILVMLVCYFLL